MSAVWRYFNVRGEGEGEGYGAPSMAVAPVSLKTRQATCGFSTCTFIPSYRPYQARSLCH